MAKRTRGSRRDRRRGARHAPFAAAAPRPAIEQRPTSGPVSPSPSAAPAAPAPTAAPRAPIPAGRPGSVLSAKAAEEYRYVTLDLRRIVLMMGSLFAAMFALWAAIELFGVIRV